MTKRILALRQRFLLLFLLTVSDALLLSNPTNDDPSTVEKQLSAAIRMISEIKLHRLADARSGKVPPADINTFSDQKSQKLNPAIEAVMDDNLPALKKIASKRLSLLFELDENRWQPIHEAARRGFVNVINYLIQKGADMNALTLDGHTPLDIGIEFHGESHPIIQRIRYLGGLSGDDFFESEKEDNVDEEDNAEEDNDEQDSDGENKNETGKEMADNFKDLMNDEL